MSFKSVIQGLLVAGFVNMSSAAFAGAIPADKLDSPVWEMLAEEYLEGGKIVFDDRVRVDAPNNAEGNLQVPVSVDAKELSGVSEIQVFVDLNPFPRVVRYEVGDAKPYIATRVKMNEGSVIRAAVRTSDGTWHVNGKYVDAAGGGCAAPSMLVSGGGDWDAHLNKVRARIWRQKDGGERLRLQVMHPMDTGLVDNIPKFYIEHLTVRDRNGKRVAHIETFEPVSENPTMTIEVPSVHVRKDGYSLQGRDNNGNEVDARISLTRGS